MTTPSYNLEIQQNADFSKTFIWKNADGTPKNLTGWAGRMQIRKGVNGDVVFDTDVTSQSLIIGTTDGTVQVSIPATSNTLFPQSGALVYDIRLVDTLHSPKRFIKGNVSIDPAVTRAT